MVEKHLSDYMIDAGDRFLAKLDEFGLSPESAGWFLDDERGDWRYLIATSAIDVTGRRKIYGAIIDLFEAFDFGPALTSMDVHLVSPREPWYAAMRGTIRMDDGRLHLQDVGFNGILIKEALVYRFFAPPSAAVLKRNVETFSKRAEKAAAYSR